MKGTKQYRFKDNPKEQEFRDKFIERFTYDSSANKMFSLIIYGEAENSNYPKRYLNRGEETACVNLIQWLGSPVGQGFLEECGFVKKEEQ